MRTLAIITLYTSILTVIGCRQADIVGTPPVKDVKGETQALELARAVAADEAAPDFRRIDALLAIGTHGDGQTDIPKIEALVAPLEKEMPDDEKSRFSVAWVHPSRPANVRQAAWVALAQLGQKQSLERVDLALRHQNPQVKAWGLMAATLVGGKRWLVPIASLLDDDRPALPVLFFTSPNGGGQMDISVAALAAKAIYTLSDPKPKCSFPIEPYSRTEKQYYGGIKGNRANDPNWVQGYACIRLSDEQRVEIRNWIKP